MPENNKGPKFFPKSYPVDINVGLNEGDQAGGTVKLDRDFVLTGIRHQIIDDGSGAAAPAVQDGAYRLDWSEQNTRRFYKGAIPMADAAWGSVRHGIWKDLDAPIKFSIHVTLETIIVNTFTRSNPWKVQVIFVGLEPTSSVE